MKNREDVPRFDLPNEIEVGPVAIPAIYVRLAGIAATFGLLWLVGQALN
jgi:hypothetical protein